MDRLTRTVREQVALGRLLPLGGPDDAAWIAESAAVRVLRRSAAGLPGVRLGEVGVLLGAAAEADVLVAAPPQGAPVGALPHLPLRVEAAFEAAVDEPLPAVAERLRDVLWAAARDGVGLAVAAVDLRVTGLLEDGLLEDGPLPPDDHDEDAAGGGQELGQAMALPGTAEALEATVRAVPGVLGLTRRLAGLGPGLRVHDTAPPHPPPPH
ncbi:MAG: hypothetical protein QOF98_3575, partial [Streptomyces sp.]|nr:hypothetical protein [Streptomyces sp.]